MSRKEGGRGHTSIEDYVTSSIQGFEDYIKQSKETLNKAVNNSVGKINTDRKKTK